MMTSAIQVADSLTKEWYSARSTGIGASEAAAACGLSEYQTRLELYLRKRGELPEIDDNAAMRMGRRLEPIIGDEFVEQTGIEIVERPMPMYRAQDYSFMLATPDGRCADGALFEAKSTNSIYVKAELGDEGTDSLPVGWLCQCQQQLAVMGAEVVHVAALLDGRTLRVFHVERNDDLIHEIIRCESELWDMVQAGTPPEPDFGHTSTLELLKTMYGAPDDETDIIDLPDDILAAWQNYEDLGVKESAIKDQRDAERARVIHAIGRHAAGFLDDGRMVRRKLTKRAGYTVQPTSFVDVRAIKIPKGLRVRA